MHATSHNTISIEANRLGAHEFVLPRLFIHHVWVGANAVCCNIMIKKFTGAKQWLLHLMFFIWIGKIVI